MSLRFIKSLACLFLSMAVLIAFTIKPFNKYDTCKTENTSFQRGEQLIYKVYYNWKFVWLPAGEVSMTVFENDNDYEVKVKGTTYEAYDNFFMVRDYFYSKIEKSTMRPLSFVRHIREGEYQLFDSISFNHQSQTAITYHGKTKQDLKVEVHRLGECMHDLVSVLYSLRNTQVESYKNGDIIPIKVFFDKEVFPIKVKYHGKVPKKDIKDLGKFNTLRISPELVPGQVFAEGTKMDIWVSDDDNKIPLMIESPLKIGIGKAVLKSYKSNRYPFSSKIKS
jgi:hypothetical protein